MSSILRPIQVFFAHLFKRTVTVRYPEVILKPSERFAGRHFLYLDRCIGCSLCVRYCPAKAVELVDFEEKKYPQINYGRCAFCQICIDVCPKQAIEMTGEYELASRDKSSLVYSPQRLSARPDVSKGREVLVLKFHKTRGFGHGFVEETT